MKKIQKKKITVDEVIANFDKMLIKNGLKPTVPANKEGSFVRITTKAEDTKFNEKDIKFK